MLVCKAMRIWLTSDCIGGHNFDKFGHDVAGSSDGSRIVVDVPHHIGLNGYRSGSWLAHITVDFGLYRIDGLEWTWQPLGWASPLASVSKKDRDNKSI